LRKLPLQLERWRCNEGCRQHTVKPIPALR